MYNRRYIKRTGDTSFMRIIIFTNDWTREERKIQIDQLVVRYGIYGKTVFSCDEEYINKADMLHTIAFYVTITKKLILHANLGRRYTEAINFFRSQGMEVEIIAKK